MKLLGLFLIRCIFTEKTESAKKGLKFVKIGTGKNRGIPEHCALGTTLQCSKRSKYYLDLHNNLNFLGAAAKLPGLMERISNDLISNRPFKSTTGVTCAENLTLDGFRGMQKFAQDFIEVGSVWITKSEYEEKGGDVLKVHCCSNR